MLSYVCTYRKLKHAFADTGAKRAAVTATVVKQALRMQKPFLQKDLVKV